MNPSQLTRRTFLGAGVAGISALSTHLTWRQVFAAQAKEPKKLVHCLSNETYSFRKLYGDHKLSLPATAQFHKELNIRGVSLNDIYFESFEREYLDKILESFKAHERLITCMIMEGNLATSNEGKRRKQIETNAMKLKAAGYLGVPVVRMNLGGVDKGEDNLKEGVDRCVGAFKELLPMAIDLGIRITIENHGGVSGTIDGILAVIKGSDPKWVGSNLDFGNPPVGHRPEVFEKLVPYAYHTHAKLADFKEDGEATNSDYGKLLGILKEKKYAGAVSVEWEGKGEAVEGVKKTRDLILKHWPELPN